MPRAGGYYPLLSSVVGDAVEPESLPISYGFFVFRRRSQFIYSLHVDQHSKHFSYVQIDSKQASVISKLTHLGTFPVETSFHKTLNISCGVLSNPDFIHVTEAEFVEELRDQNACAARRINIRRDGRLIPTQHVVLTFQTPVLPKSIKAGYINCKLRPYIPNPLRCFKCQRYGHSQQSCRGTDLVCGKCAESGQEINVCTSDTFNVEIVLVPMLHLPNLVLHGYLKKKLLKLKLKGILLFLKQDKL
ncbi:hypothetical protein AVEN_263680-1 [Araneus ventricosus]|uniref:CCHC-type domain-containing protein n=1 Tax=Araneus ventricosus TaxID=182803 RepID=A0A4Y2AUH7_ARAVE|nr:hypothetical protein AVEN_263680-1 [Araneus ventricosus]